MNKKKKRKVRTQAGSCPTISRDNIKRDPLWLEHCAAIRAERSTSRRLHSQWIHCLFHLRSRVGQWPSMRQLLFVWSDDRGSLASTKMHLTSSSNSSSSFFVSRTIKTNGIPSIDATKATFLLGHFYSR